MKCLYFDKECFIVEQFGELKPDEQAAFCKCCVTKNDSDRLTKELKINRMALIANLLALFPNDEMRAKEVYQKLQRCVEEWEVK